MLFFVFDSNLDQYKCEETCDSVVCEDLSLIVSCPDKYITYRMCDEAVDDSLAALRLIPDWFVPSKIIKGLCTVFAADENILNFNEDSGNVIFSCNGMGILNIDLHNINVDQSNYDEDDPDSIILITLLAWHIKFEKHKALKQ